MGYDPEHTEEEEEEEDERYPVRVVKSGTDFREFSYLKIEIESDSTTGKKYIKAMSGKKKKITRVYI